jgi:molecular chaperone IbpA
MNRAWPYGKPYNRNIHVAQLEDMVMTRLDFSPFMRSAIGFDRMARLLESAHTAEIPAYPPYDIVKTGEDDYRISMAVAGFAPEELSIITNENTLSISGKAQENGETAQYLHHGIARRAFERRFDLADFIKVAGAKLENGLLHISLKREVPETMKPKNIPIETGSPALLEAKKAA